LREIKPVSKGRLMGGSFDTENRRLTRRATSSDTE
jgi:hypothetical protein